MAFGSISNSLKKTRESVFSKISRLVTAKNKIDEDVLDQIEEILIAGDIGVDTSMFILDKIREQVKKERYDSAQELNRIIHASIAEILSTPTFKMPENKPYVVLVVGVNGTGKTTSIAKLAHFYKSNHKKVILAAADTFRAAAIEQLCLWGERINCDVIRHQANADPAAVVFDAVSAAISRSVDVLIIDTAGRLHTKVNLMSELEKIKKVISRQVTEAPHEVILVLDAGNGQNALSQAREFIKTSGVDSIFLTKLDGTAKGGIVLSIQRELGIPVRYLGVGEKKEDFAIFDAEEFAKALFEGI
ncbi:MAG: signal recognition particle-docking protein FtsY [Calditrichaceae bacterium]|nr:signal recognition particle-docking protein FtsY [Calditrichaceae bacterium]MBN2710393.1 signal recognition particle-docking protein FtsY [Calditrichaceae bacterium]RQV92885.1 MAG: signal recognition particle-docking protein FtsY [Calditrichota bacterium]